jgi:hypothetical protein
VETEAQAIQAIEEQKAKQNEGGYKLTKSGYTYRTKKQKGEIVDEWYLVSVQRDYDE